MSVQGVSSAGAQGVPQQQPAQQQLPQHAGMYSAPGMSPQLAQYAYSGLQQYAQYNQAAASNMYANMYGAYGNYGFQVGKTAPADQSLLNSASCTHRATNEAL